MHSHSTSGKEFRQGFQTRCVHAGVEPEPITGAVMTPIFQTSTYAQQGPNEHKGYDYSRGGNPTRDSLEKSLAALEKAQFAISFASGLAAVQAVVQTLSPGDHVLVCDDVYGGTGRLFRKLFAKYGLEFEFIDMRDAYSVKEHLKSNTKLIWLETPTNPLLHLVDISEVCKSVQGKGILVAVDNTFASPYFQLPLTLGADLVVHSSTKYLGGHSDLVGGVVMTSHPALAQELKFIQFAGGAVNAPFECFLLLRSVKTLGIRMERHQKNALKVAQFLESHSSFFEVIYPGLSSHPQHALALKQMSGFSGIVSARYKGNFEQVKVFLSKLKLFTLAESLGGVESLVNHPETMTHASVPPDHREKLGITQNLLRFSVGIEDEVDLIEDLKQAAEG
jgi:cystathionine gamma-lyase